MLERYDRDRNARLSGMAGWDKSNGGMRDAGLKKPMLDPRLQLIDGTPITRNSLPLKLVATSRKMLASEFVAVFNFSYNRC